MIHEVSNPLVWDYIKRKFLLIVVEIQFVLQCCIVPQNISDVQQKNENSDLNVLPCSFHDFLF